MTVHQRSYSRQPLSLSASAGAVFASNCDKSPQIDHEAAGAMGFLSFVERGTKEKTHTIVNPNTQFVSELLQLRVLFPEFPAPMMKNLLLREGGKGHLVYQQLTSRGWVPIRRLKNGELLSNTTNPLFDVSYFWGLWRPEYSKILSKKKAGSFITGFRPHKSDSRSAGELQYFVWVVDHKKKVRKWSCQSAAVSSSELNIFSLRHEVPRPDVIPLAALVRLERS